MLKLNLATATPVPNQYAQCVPVQGPDNPSGIMSPKKCRDIRAGAKVTMTLAKSAGLGKLGIIAESAGGRSTLLHSTRFPKHFQKLGGPCTFSHDGL